MNTTDPIIFFFCILFLASVSAYAADCEVVETSYFERSQDEIVTGWTAGIPHRKQKTAVIPLRPAHGKEYRLAREAHVETAGDRDIHGQEHCPKITFMRR